LGSAIGLLTPFSGSVRRGKGRLGQVPVTGASAKARTADVTL
jgi:hypothetical protein